MNDTATLSPDHEAASRRDSRISRQTLMRLSHASARTTFQIREPVLAARDTVIQGHFKNVECHSGLWVHATDTTEAHDLSLEWHKDASLSVAVILEGALNVWLDDVPMQFGRPGQAAGQIWSLARLTRMQRNSQRGMRVRKVVISIPPAWVKPLLHDGQSDGNGLGRFLSDHRANRAWTPSRHALSLAEQIISPPAACAPIQSLSVEAKAIDIVREALSVIMTPDRPETAKEPTVRDQSRAQRIRQYLQDNLDRRPSLQAMSREFGMSIGSMQSAFKHAYRTTIAEFCRELRLQRARSAIEQDGISISEAAYAAGYTSPASFSTAFKRYYGFPPSAAKE